MLGHDIFNVFYDRYEVVGKGKREVDVTLFSDVSRVVTSMRPDFIINASAYTKVDASEDHFEEAKSVNSEALKHISTTCKKIGSVLIHFSTDFVFDGENKSPYVEEDEPSPINRYGESKLGGEMEIRSSGCEHIIVRTQWLFGPRGKNFVFSIIDTLKRDRQVFVVDDQYGCPTYTVDLARAVDQLMKLDRRGIYHFSGEGEVSWFEFARKIADYSISEEVSILPMKSAELEGKARRPKNSVLSKGKYINAVGEHPRRWEEMLQDFLKRTFEGGVAW